MYNRLTELPPEIGRLANLEKLNLGQNRLESLPPEIGDLQRVGKGMSEGLNLSYNCLKTVPPELSKIKIWRLRLEHNELTELPPVPIGRDVDLSTNG